MRLYTPYSISLFGGTVIFFVFSFSMFFFSLPSQNIVAEAATAGVRIAGDVRPLEIHISDNGLILLRSARVVAVSGTTVTVSTTWGLADFRWTVRTNASSYETHDFGTRFLDRDGKKFTLPNVHVGDLVTITGKLDGAADIPTLDAGTVRSLE